MPIIKPLRRTTIVGEIMAAYNEAVREDPHVTQRDPQRLLTVRASQLPFCGLQFATVAAQYGTASPLGFHGLYFTSVGTAVHTVLQTFMGRGGKLLANWECKICGKKRAVSHEPKCCDFWSEYDELLIDYTIKIEGKRVGRVVGHVDAVFRAKDGRYWVIDFKTTSGSLAEDKAKDPGRAYREQVECYAYTLKKQYGLDIAGVAVVFVTRDNPTTPNVWAREVDDNDMEVIERRLVRYIRQHRYALNARTKEHLMTMWKNRPCRTLDEAAEFSPFCGYAGVCSGKDPAFFISNFKRGLANRFLPVRTLIEEFNKPEE